MLLVLAVLYWFKKIHKTKYEFGEISNRIVVGSALILVGVATVIGDKPTGGFKFKSQPLDDRRSGVVLRTRNNYSARTCNFAIPTDVKWVVLAVYVVLLQDNILLALARRTSRRNARRSASRGRSPAFHPETSTLHLLLRHPFGTTTSRSPSRSGTPSRALSPGLTL